MVLAGTSVFFMIMSALLLVSLGRVQIIGLVSNDWSLGQIIAVAIWAPIVFRWLYWALCESQIIYEEVVRLTNLPSSQIHHTSTRIGSSSSSDFQLFQA